MIEGNKSTDNREAVELTVNKMNSYVTDMLIPIWNFRVEYAKLLISLCSVILFGSITFSSSILKTGSGIMHAPWLLVVSWSLIFFSLLFGLVCVWLHISCLNFKNNLFDLIPDLADIFGIPEKDPEVFSKKVSNIMKSKAFESMLKANKQAYIMIKTSIACFSFGLATFIVFGTLQFI